MSLRFHPPLIALARRLVAARGLLLFMATMPFAGVVMAQATPTYAELQPILHSRCVMCHTGASAPLGLQLDSLAGLLKGSSRGPVVKAGDAAGSELIRRLKGQSQPRMPMTGPPWLSDTEVSLFERWVAGGLNAGAAMATPQPVTLPAPARPKAGEVPTWAHVAPIFATRCAKCHSPQGLMGPAPEGYLLNSYEGALSASDRVRIVPGQPLASELLRRIRGHARPRMPFDGPPYLSDAEITLISDWIAAGARDGNGTPAPVPAGARIRMRGVLSADGTLDGLVIPSGGRRDKQPYPGDGVELRGVVLPDGQIATERVRRR
jgi:mono/diheme cytochrome c family protein